MTPQGWLQSTPGSEQGSCVPPVNGMLQYRDGELKGTPGSGHSRTSDVTDAFAMQTADAALRRRALSSMSVLFCLPSGDSRTEWLRVVTAQGREP